MTLVPPLFVTVSDKVSLLPTVTLPNARLVGFPPREPADTPVPATGILSVELVAFDVTVTLPLMAPADCGSNDTVNVALLPPPKVTGGVIPLNESPAPETAALEIVTLVPPVFVTVSDKF